MKPSPQLFDKIMARISREEKLLIIKRKVFLYSSGLAATGLFGFIAVSKFYSDMVSSGSVDFLSLVLTDFKSVIANFGDYAMSLLESIPVGSLALLSGVITIFIFSLSRFSSSYVELKKITIH